LESFCKYLISDVRRRIEAQEAYLKKELQFSLEEGDFFGKCGVNSSVFRQRTLALSCEHESTGLFYTMHETGLSWGNLH
jgi:hypothetical protein